MAVATFVVAMLAVIANLLSWLTTDVKLPTERLSPRDRWRLINAVLLVAVLALFAIHHHWSL